MDGKYINFVNGCVDHIVCCSSVNLQILCSNVRMTLLCFSSVDNNQQKIVMCFVQMKLRSSTCCMDIVVYQLTEVAG